MRFFRVTQDEIPNKICPYEKPKCITREAFTLCWNASNAFREYTVFRSGKILSANQRSTFNTAIKNSMNMLRTKRNSNSSSYEINMKCKLAVKPSNSAKPVLSCDQEAALLLLPTFTLGSTMTFWLNLGMRKTNFFSPSSNSNFGNPSGMAVYLSSSVTTWKKKREERK